MRSIWNGSISFGLVSIPVKLYSAVSPTGISFKLLCRKCMTPVHYERKCEGCKGEVKWEDTLKALDLGDGQYLPFEQDELDAIRPEKTDRIEIVEFVSQDEIEPLYYNKFYFCAPPKSTDRSFFLFHRVLSDSKMVAIGRFVMREKEYVCSISAYGKGLLLSTLNYAYEIRDIEDIGVLAEAPKLKKEEIQLAKKLVDQLTQKEFKLEEFEDTFAEKLQEMVKKKEKVFVPETQEERPFDEKSLMEALQASLN